MTKIVLALLVLMGGQPTYRHGGDYTAIEDCIADGSSYIALHAGTSYQCVPTNSPKLTGLPTQ